MKSLTSLFLLSLLLTAHFNVSAVMQTGPVEPVEKADRVNKEFDYDTALKVSQAAIGRQLGSYTFTNSDGQKIAMADFRGKPLVLSMVYTSCYQICPMTTRHLSKVVEKARESLGKDSFSVAVVGFDTFVDKPDAMKYFANKQGIHNKDWHVLSIEKDTLDALSKDTGFIYFPSANGFDHLIQVTVIDAEGIVYRQVYGQAFETPMLIEPLKELVLGRPRKNQTLLAELTQKIKLFCTIYDPVRDGYYFDYSLFLGMLIGASIIILMAVFALREYRKSGQGPAS